MWMSHILAVHSPSLICSPSAPVHNLEAAKAGRRIREWNQTTGITVLLSRIYSQDGHMPVLKRDAATSQMQFSHGHNHPLCHHVPVAFGCCSPLQLALCQSLHLALLLFSLVTIGTSADLEALIPNCTLNIYRDIGIQCFTKIYLMHSGEWRGSSSLLFLQLCFPRASHKFCSCSLKPSDKTSDERLNNEHNHSW